MPSLFLIRHAPTKWNNPDREVVRSQLAIKPDPEKLKQWLRHVGPILEPKHVAFVAASTVPRGRESGRALADWLGLPDRALLITPELDTWQSPGDAEGEPYDKVEPLIRYYVEHPREKPEGGEAYQTLIDRFGRVLRALRQLAAQSGRNGAAVIHGNEFMLLPHVLAGEPRRFVPHDQLPRPGTIYEVTA